MVYADRGICSNSLFSASRRNTVFCFGVPYRISHALERVQAKCPVAKYTAVTVRIDTEPFAVSSKNTWESDYMKILVTGGAGFIGGTVTRFLLAGGHSATVFDNLSHSNGLPVARGAEFVQGDLADRALLENTLEAGRFDAVMHFAGRIEVAESMKRPEIYFRNNTAATLSLLEAMLATGHDRMLFSSTAACYGESEATPILEDASLKPTNPYGESKLLVERMLGWMNVSHGFRYASLRYFNVAGAIEGYGEAHEPESHLIPLILDVALGRRPSIKIFGRDYPTRDGTCVRDYIHVWDLAEAHLLALEALKEKSRVIYNIGNGQGFTVLEVIDSVRRVTGRPIPVEECERRAGDPAVLVASSEKIRLELGWEPQFAELDEIIASAWDWQQRHYS
jgi:UDP-glucose 4-epimerase